MYVVINVKFVCTVFAVNIVYAFIIHINSYPTELGIVQIRKEKHNCIGAFSLHVPYYPVSTN